MPRDTLSPSRSYSDDWIAICLVRAVSRTPSSIHRAFMERPPAALTSLEPAVRIIEPWRQFAVVKKLRHRLLYESVFTRERVSKVIVGKTEAHVFVAFVVGDARSGTKAVHHRSPLKRFLRGF